MAKLYTVTERGTGSRRYYVTENEAKMAAAENGGEIASEIVDEIDVRNWAAKWRNSCEIRREIAKLREAKKTNKRKSEIAEKVWAKRRENGTDKRK